MIKKLLTSSLAAVAITGSALAADLPARMAPPPPPPPVYSWTGCYVGVNGGGAFTRSQSLPYYETFGAAPFFPATGGYAEFGPYPSRSGGFGGGQIGCNLQTGMFVFGGELDGQAARLNSAVATTITPYLGGGSAISIGSTQRIDYFGTARGRAGITFGGFGAPGGLGLGGPVLLYVTGGLAYAGVREGFAMNDTFGYSASTFGDNSRVGYTIGGGIEWMFLPNWSIKGEYQYIGLGHGPNAVANEFVGGTRTTFAISTTEPRIQMHTARIGLNYHFGWTDSAPVVARY